MVPAIPKRGSEALGVQDPRNMVVVRNIGVSLDVCFGLFWHIGSLVPSRLDKSTSLPLFVIAVETHGCCSKIRT